MTTIAYKDGIMAADTQVSGSSTKFASIVKIAKTPSGSLVGAAGHCTWINKLITWASSSDDDATPPLPEIGHGSGFLIRPDRTIVGIEETGTFECASPYYATGSGEKFAMGVMAFGGSAEDAVRVSINLDLATGGEVITISQNGAA